MGLLRSLAISGLIALSAFPRALTAQASSGAQIFTSIDNSFPGGAGVAGFGLSVGKGSIGVRGSFGLGISAFTSGSAPNSSASPRQWIGDADLVLGDGLGGLAGVFGGALQPYAFAGIGAHSSSASPSISSAAKTWSYGGGVTVPIGGPIAFIGEARYRNLLSDSVAPPRDFVRGSEYRVGISLRFGSQRRAAGYGARAESRTGRAGGSSRTTWPAGATSASAAARRVVPDAEQYIGVPYVYGGSSPSGFDCSGFVQYVYARQGVELPRTSRQMAGSGVAVNPNSRAMAVGDLMLFSQGGRISHVAIYAGGGRFIHSSSSGRGVRYDDLNTHRGQWFADHLVAARRVAGDGRGTVMAFAKSLIPFDHFDPPDSAPPPGNR